MVYGCSSAPLAARQPSSRIVGYLRLHIWSLSRLVQARVWAAQVQVDAVGTWTRYFWYQVPIHDTVFCVRVRPCTVHYLYAVLQHNQRGPRYRYTRTRERYTAETAVQP